MYDMKNSTDQERCYPQRPKAKVDYILQDLQNSSYPMNAVFKKGFIIHSKYFLDLKEFRHFTLWFSAHEK